MTARIDHAMAARQHIEWTQDWLELEGSTPEANLAMVLLAQAEATLALVEQQQIANKIALSRETFAALEASEALGTHRTAKFGERIVLRPDIAAALGIEVQS